MLLCQELSQHFTFVCLCQAHHNSQGMVSCSAD